LTPTYKHNVNNYDVLRRPKEWDNNTYLYHIYNDLGIRGLRIAHNYTDEQGELRFSKWIDYNTLMHLEPGERVPGMYMDKNEFIAKATHRTILDIEVMLDVDEPATSAGFETIDETSAAIIAFLRKHGFSFVVHHTGNKSYHISFLHTDLRNKSKNHRRKLKSWILEESLGADGMKTSSNQMIALEGAPHYRSGEPKKEVMCFVDGEKV